MSSPASSASSLPPVPVSSGPVQLRRLGLVEYEDGLALQQQLVEARQAGLVADQLLVVHHPHVYTLGRRARLEHVLVDEADRARLGVQLHESVRGGDVTYHGPGQIVVYPILGLPPSRQDVVRYVRDLEEAMIRTLAEYGIAGGRLEGLSGAWVKVGTPEAAKIGAVGVRMSRWVTSHGIALNVSPDLGFFGRIVPCGIREHGVTSLEQLLGRPVPLAEVEGKLVRQLEAVFGLKVEEVPIERPTIQTLPYRWREGLELLCIHRVPAKGDFWQPVTGWIEPGERPEEAAGREAEEELGLRGQVESLEYVHSFMLDPKVLPPPQYPLPCFLEEHAYALPVEVGAEVRLEARTHDAYAWLRPEEAIQRVKWVGNREAIRRLVARLEPEKLAGLQTWQ